MTFKSSLAGVSVAAALIAAAGSSPAFASSHMDAPLITFDDPANTTDVYAFRSESDGTQYLTTALSVYPFEEPGIGPNNYRFDDRVRYEIHVALGDDLAKGRASLTYRFDFNTRFQNRDTILQSYLGVIEPVEGKPRRLRDRFDGNQNLRQTYRVTKVDNRTGRTTRLGHGIVPPNNQGQVTPFYNQDNDGDKPAKPGVDKESALDPYTLQAISDLRRGYRSFAGQRDDGFYADIQDIFDLDLLGTDPNGFAFGTVTDSPSKPFDSQGGFNVHTIVLNIPLVELDGEKAAGVYATTSRSFGSRDNDDYDDERGYRGDDDDERGYDGDDRRYRDYDDRRFSQVGRQGNPLFVEALIAGRDKDRYNRTRPTRDERFRVYAQDPVPGSDEGVEISRLLGVTPPVPGLLEFIFIPDLIKVDLTTGPARTPNDPDFNRLSGILDVLGGGDLTGADVLINGDGEVVFGGWPNGRRFGDDVLDIALLAVGTAPAFPAAADGPNFDGVTANDITYNDVFPFAATPLNGRTHGHHGEPGASF